MANAEITPIDAARNARMHNAKGVEYMRAKDYLAAIKEFKMAIALNPNTQAASTYYHNLATSYMQIYKYSNHPTLPIWAQSSYEQSLKTDVLNLSTYKGLVQTYKAQNILSQKALEVKDTIEINKYNTILLGLIYIENNEKEKGLNYLIDFCVKNPDLIIVPDLQKIIKQYDLS